MFRFKVLFLAVVALFTTATVNAEVATDSINGSDKSVTFIKINTDTYRAVLTNSSKPFDITVRSWEWARSVMTFASATSVNDSVEVTVKAGNNAYKFWSLNKGWLKTNPGVTVVVTEIYSDQGDTTKKYLAYTEIREPEEAALYAAYAPKAKPASYYRSNANSASQNKSTADNNKKAKGKKGSKRLTEEEVMEDVLANTGDYYIEEEGNPRVK